MEGASFSDATSRIETVPGAGGLPRIAVSNPLATADIYLHGAQVASWRPAGQRDVLWMSPRSHFTPGKAIRGGVPICWPWFSAHPTDPALPSHGFARLRDWRVERAEAQADGSSVIELSLESDAASLAMWPHSFRATYRVVIGARLEMTLAVENRSGQEAVLSEALHSYFAVGDVRRCTVTGLQGRSYRDRSTGPTPAIQGQSALAFAGETDRVYLATTDTCTIEDPVHRRRITIAKSGSESTVVWNPWTDRARELTDLGEDAWPGMLCVETANAGEHSVRVPAGGRHEMSATFSVAAI
ncbi:MAG: D-hexose-6-phosphate mutarotase [Planctomycetes bacterium]|nr:D-hexose-6-phosphate mutarotase [Planctomycetota bacterium]